MSIPKLQLQTWSNIGATDLPQKTHTSIRNALDTYKGWQESISYDAYLQGSCRNTTNIHYGTTWYLISNDYMTIKRKYFTGRGRQTYGVAAAKTQKNIKKINKDLEVVK